MNWKWFANGVCNIIFCRLDAFQLPEALCLLLVTVLGESWGLERLLETDFVVVFTALKLSPANAQTIMEITEVLQTDRVWLYKQKTVFEGQTETGLHFSVVCRMKMTVVTVPGGTASMCSAPLRSPRHNSLYVWGSTMLNANVSWQETGCGARKDVLGG